MNNRSGVLGKLGYLIHHMTCFVALDKSSFLFLYQRFTHLKKGCIYTLTDKPLLKVWVDMIFKKTNPEKLDLHCHLLT